jgi:nucleotide-binding universal stress UspA family protein
MEIRVIICPIDFSSISVRAYRHALSLAEHYRAKLLAVHIIEEWRYSSADFAASAHDLNEFYRGLHEVGSRRLREFVKNHTHNELEPELIVERGSTSDSILTLAEIEKADVLVMGTHGQRGFDRIVLGSTTDRVMRTEPCPVFVVPPQDMMALGDDLHGIRHLKRILFCADFSANSGGALRYAISVADEYDAELILVHVLEDGPSPDKVEENTAKAMEQLKGLLPVDPLRKIRTAVRIGKPYRELIRYAQEEQPDLVAMGVRGRGALDIAVFGSTTYRVMQLGACPVLAVHV